MRPLRARHLMLTLGWGIALIFVAQPVGADYYVYQERDGTKWYTNRRLPGDKYTLIDRIGRPTASGSCVGVTNAIMEQRAVIYAPVIEQYAQIYGVDAQLIKAVISVESCFDRYAVSHVGAKGLMQLMPGTAQRMGIHNVFDANDNLRGGIRYFSEMLTRFRQDVELALAAYNAGPGAVEKYKGIPPYKETQNYIKRVLGHYDGYAGLKP